MGLVSMIFVLLSLNSVFRNSWPRAGCGVRWRPVQMWLGQGLLVEAVFEDGLDALVAVALDVERTFAGGFEPGRGPHSV